MGAMGEWEERRTSGGCVIKKKRVEKKEGLRGAGVLPIPNTKKKHQKKKKNTNHKRYKKRVKERSGGRRGYLSCVMRIVLGNGGEK